VGVLVVRSKVLFSIFFGGIFQLLMQRESQKNAITKLRREKKQTTGPTPPPLNFLLKAFDIDMDFHKKVFDCAFELPLLLAEKRTKIK
jgi:hypothetical protein